MFSNAEMHKICNAVYLFYYFYKALKTINLQCLFIYAYGPWWFKLGHSLFIFRDIQRSN